MAHKWRKWTDKEIQILQENKDLLIKQQAHLLGRTVASILYKRHQLGIKRKRYRYWTKEELEYIKQNKDMSNKVIAQQLQRHCKDISKKRAMLGLKKRVVKKWTKEEKQLILDNYKKLSRKYIAHLLDRNYNSVNAQFYRLNIKNIDKQKNRL